MLGASGVHSCRARLPSNKRLQLTDYSSPRLGRVAFGIGRGCRGEAFSRAFIVSGTASMPNLGLSEDEVSAVIAYLTAVDQTGTYPPKNYEVHWTGNVSQEDDPE